ncbi:transposase [Candidatus Nitrososphaera gargensis]|nr:transposase [Candidatus Nitrososphaera gargensis]
MNETIEICRHLYNDSLGERSSNWSVGFYEQKQLLTLRRQDNKYYKQVHSQVLQDIVLRLDKAYQAFFKKYLGIQDSSEKRGTFFHIPTI